MAAMMPSASTANDPYDDDALERDLIDPDDGKFIAVRSTTLHQGYREPARV